MADDEHTILGVLDGKPPHQCLDLASRHDPAVDRQHLRQWLRGLNRPQSLARVNDTDAGVSEDAG